MKKSKNSYQIFNNYVLRTPLFSLNAYLNLTAKNSISDKKLKKIIASPLFKEAIYIASPNLLDAIEKWENGVITDAKKIAQLKVSILKYLTRMSSRCTPFGLFASCGVGEFSEKTNIELLKPEDYNRITRFDMTFLEELINNLLKNENLKEQLKFYPNTSLYAIADHYRYVEHSITDKKKNYFLEGIKHSNYLQLLLTNAKQGATITELAALLVDEDITITEAKDFVNNLIEHQILTSELELTLTGVDNLTRIITVLETKQNVTPITKQLKGFKTKLQHIDVSLGNPIQLYKALEDELQQLNISTKYLFQTDTFTTYKANTLSNEIKKALKQVMPLLNKMSLAYQNKNLNDFKADFTSRYEDQEIPLTLALDAETGIGYSTKRSDDNALINQLQFNPHNSTTTSINWSTIDSILQSKVMETLMKNEYITEIKDTDFKDFNANWQDLPDTMSSIIELVNQNNTQKIIINGVGGASAGNLLARFGFGSHALNKHLNHITTHEQSLNKDKIIAEIVHLPQSRTGNILQRPAFRDYEIPYLAKSSLSKNQQVPITDITIAVKNNHIQLRSKSLNKTIEPRLTNAHNYAYNALPIYHFLCDLQTQNKRSSIGFSWNPILQKLPFLPRVEYKNCILSKARWLINVTTIKNLYTNTIELHAVSNWRKQLKLPKYVELVEGDNTLLINFENINTVEMLFNAVKNKKTFILEEFLSTKKDDVQHKGEAYCNQFVVSFYKDQISND